MAVLIRRGVQETREGGGGARGSEEERIWDTRLHRELILQKQLSGDLQKFLLAFSVQVLSENISLTTGWTPAPQLPGVCTV